VVTSQIEVAVAGDLRTRVAAVERGLAKRRRDRARDTSRPISRSVIAPLTPTSRRRLASEFFGWDSRPNRGCILPGEVVPSRNHPHNFLGKFRPSIEAPWKGLSNVPQT
jgi:hypothetical protein